MWIALIHMEAKVILLQYRMLSVSRNEPYNVCIFLNPYLYGAALMCRFFFFSSASNLLEWPTKYIYHSMWFTYGSCFYATTEWTRFIGGTKLCYKYYYYYHYIVKILSIVWILKEANISSSVGLCSHSFWMNVESDL